MGRKKKEARKPGEIYFGEASELAVQEYLTATTEERSAIYANRLREPLHRLIESIIKTYRLYREDINIVDLEQDTLSFLITKFDKFDPSKNTKAYSYYGTVCKHYLQSQLVKFSKHKNRSISYEDISSSLEENPEYSYEIEDGGRIETTDFIKVLVERLENELETNRKLKANEIKVGTAVVEILKNWDKTGAGNDKSNIFAKNKILYDIREATFLNSKEVRNALTKFKTLYFIIKKDIYNKED